LTPASTTLSKERMNLNIPAKQPNDLLELIVGGSSETGKREVNQDAFAVKIPTSYTEKKHKGIVASIADGVSCSSKSQQASHTSVTQFINDYYCTPENWDTKLSAGKVLNSLNSWLYQHGNNDQIRHDGLITTFSSVIFKSTTAYLLHVGDTRIYRYRDSVLKQLSKDHCRAQYGKNSVLTRALGMDSHLEVDFQTTELQQDDLFFLSSDGVHDWLSKTELAEHLSTLKAQESSAAHFENLAKAIGQHALDNGSTDNLTCLLLKVKSLPVVAVDELQKRLTELTIPPALHEGNEIDHFKIQKVIHEGPRSHVYLAIDKWSKRLFVLKMPSLNFSDDLVYLDGFSKEQWVGRKLSHPSIMSILPKVDGSPFLYHICEYIKGITLRQWIYDNPNPPLEIAREIIHNIVAAVRVLQRSGMVHRDLKPENIMISVDNKITIIDFGTIKIDSLDEISAAPASEEPLGATHYIAPEYLNEGNASSASDLFSIAVIAYELLSGHLPYKPLNSQSLSRARNSQWKYRPIKQFRPDLPDWIDLALQKGAHPVLAQRYSSMSEFTQDLYTPNIKLLRSREAAPLLERNPVKFWQILSTFLFFIALMELVLLLGD
ncbi:MAG: serine/threonine protein phosphatase PrpC/predicted Ser/Thr protein kinase, partial [Psychromonas sp.]